MATVTVIMAMIVGPGTVVMSVAVIAVAVIGGVLVPLVGHEILPRRVAF